MLAKEDSLMSVDYAKSDSGTPSSQSHGGVIANSNSVMETTPASTAPPASSPSIENSSHPPDLPSPITESTSTSLPTSQSQSQPQKRKQSNEPLTTKSSKKQKQKGKSGQAKLTAFFAQPTSSTSAFTSTNTTVNESSIASFQDQHQVDSDYRLALQLSASHGTFLTEAAVQSALSSSSSAAVVKTRESEGGKTATAAWSHLLAPIQPPKCSRHNEPAKELTVTKPGPNKGKNFFICSRPVGPGYDRGKTERLREEVDHRYRCNFFKWSSEVKREVMKGQ